MMPMDHALHIPTKIAGDFRRILRANFIAGLFVAVPLGITLWCLRWFWTVIEEPLTDLFQILFGEHGTFVAGGVLTDVLPAVLGLLIVLALITILGLVTRNIVGRWLLHFFERLVAGVPIAGVIYTSVKQIGQALLTIGGESRFAGAVMVQFPSPGNWTVGFITGRVEGLLDVATKDAANPEDERLTVFVPMTPLPSAGFMVVVRRKDVRELPLSVPDAFKLVVSGGLIVPPGVKNRLLTSAKRKQAQKPYVNVGRKPRWTAAGCGNELSVVALSNVAAVPALSATVPPQFPVYQTFTVP